MTDRPQVLSYATPRAAHRTGHGPLAWAAGLLLRVGVALAVMLVTSLITFVLVAWVVHGM